MATVVEHDVKPTRHSDNELFELSVRMATARFAARDVVEVIHPSDAERNVIVALDERKVAARIRYAWQLDDSALIHSHELRDATANAQDLDYRCRHRHRLRLSPFAPR